MSIPSNQEIFDRLLQTGNDAQQSAASDDGCQRTRLFMNAVYDLGRVVYLDKLKWDDSTLISLLDQSAKLMIHFHPRIVQYISWVERRLRNNFEEALEIPAYVEACRERSAIQFLRQLYKSTPYGQYLYQLDTDDLDEDLKRKSEWVGDIGQSPEGIPTEHWWWFVG